MKKILVSILGLAFYASSVFAAAESATGFGKDDYVRVVINNQVNKQEVSDDFTLDSDADNINQIYKVTSSATTTQGNTAGNVFKGYYSNNFAAGNSEITGAAVFLKNTATQGAGAKSAILSCHEHSSSTTTIDRGIAIFGDPTSVLYASGTSTNLIKVVSGNEGISAGSTKSTPGTVNKWLVVEIAGTTHYVPCYTSKTS